MQKGWVASGALSGKSGPRPLAAVALAPGMATLTPVRLAWCLLLDSQSAMSLRRDCHPGEVRARCMAGAHEPEVPWLMKVMSQRSGWSRGIPSCLHVEPLN